MDGKEVTSFSQLPSVLGDAGRTARSGIFREACPSGILPALVCQSALDFHYLPVPRVNVFDLI